MLNRILFFVLLAFPRIAFADVSLTSEIESLYYKGQYEVSDTKEKKVIFQKALDISEENLKKLVKETGEEDLFTLSEERQLTLLKKVPDSHEVLFWATITWGVWGMTFGDFKAALNDVAGKCARYSKLLMEIDPKYRDGAGYRLLGRLHTVVPKIPFFTNWIDREHGIKLLQMAVATSTKDLRNELFLGEALYKYKPDQKQFALELIKGVASEPEPTDKPEVLETIHQAKEFLNKVRK